MNAFEDKRSEPPTIFNYDPEFAPALRIASDLYTSDLELPEFPSLPGYYIEHYQAKQPYHMEIWCEKSTMNDILLPLARRYGMTLQIGVGELSISATRDLAKRIAAYGKPTRIFYVSDYDPGGLSMPVAVARKLEYFVRSESLQMDVRLFPAILTAEQLERYSLPRSPIKDTERRKSHFELIHGEGATELDALEALHPGELERILRGYIECYYDTSLAERTSEARVELERSLNRIGREVIRGHRNEIDEARAELAAIQADFGPRMQAYSEHIQRLWTAISTDLTENAPDLDEYPMPEPREATEIADGLYNSERNYLDQIDAYKEFQGKNKPE